VANRVSGGGMRKNPERGAYGNKRGKEAQVRRRNGRMQQPRVRVALEETREHQARIAQAAEAEAQKVQARVAHVHTNPPVFMGDPPRYACCAQLAPKAALNSGSGSLATPTKQAKKQTAVRKKKGLPETGDGNGAWTLGQARTMLRQGYLLSHVVTMTGFGTKWFDDMPLEDGRGVPL